ncbi:MAG: permease-like cell division protein FtsX [Lachnospirales bacterium]
MKLRTWKYYIKQGFRGIAKNGLMSLASIVIVSACAFIVILSLCIAANINYMLEQVESKVGVTLFIGDKPTDEQVMELKAEIEAMNHVTEVRYKSADEALEEYGKKTNQNFESFKEDNPLPRSLEVSLDDINSQAAFIDDIESLQLSFEKKILGIEDDDTVADTSTQATTQTTTQPQTVAQPQTQAQTVAQPQTQAVTQPKVNAPQTQTATQAQQQAQPQTQPTTLPPKNEAEQPQAISPNMPEKKSEPTTALVLTDGPVLGDADYKFQGIESIQHAQRLTEVLVTIDTVFKIVAIVLIAILCVIAIGIIMNTIKLTVFIRKNEIGIMKYVGATDWFIRWPFIIEGIVIGIIGAIIPVGFCWVGYLKLYDMFNNTNLLTALGHLKEGNELFYVIAPVTVGVGVLLGAIGSINSIRKHLKV